MEKTNIEKFLQQDRYTFDQDKNIGRRSLITNFSEEEYINRKDEIMDLFEKQNNEAIKLILSYYDKHKDKLDSTQSLLLLRHAGQGYAMNGDSKNAIKLFQKVYQIETNIPNDYGVGLDYIEATIAFLSNDGDRLKEITTTMDKRLRNYDVVQRLYLGYKEGKSYFDSYSGL